MLILTYVESDEWMDLLVAGNEGNLTFDSISESPFKELDDYLDGKLVSRVACPDIISWWGVSVYSLEFPTMN